MMLQHGEDDPVPLAQIRRTPALGDEVDPLGRTAHEDDLVLALRPDEIGDAPPCRFVAERHLRAAPIDAAMDGRVILAQSARHRVDHLLRLLRGCRRVEIMPRPAVRRQEAGKIRLA